MKLRVNRQELAEALAAAGSVAAGRTPKPILQCVLLEAHSDCCVLKATDLELSIRCTVTQVEVDQTGEVLVSADKLSHIVRESNEEILAIEAGEGVCHVRGQDSHFQIYMQNASEFPPVPTMEKEPDFEVETAVLRRLAEWTAFAAARENSRYAINGVLWEKDKGKLLLTATDGRRLSHASGKVKGGDDSSVRAIVPVKAMILFMRILTEADTAVGVKVTGNQVLLRAARATVSSSLIEGQFPNYRDVIPDDSDKQAELSTAEFLSAIRRAALLTNEESRSVRLSFDKDELTLTSRAPEQGEAMVRMLAAYQGEPVEIGFNPVFLVDVLKVVDDERVKIELKAPNRPGVIRGGGDALYVVMPLNLS
jgi:DNA polymerase-3 subunit beta